MTYYIGRPVPSELVAKTYPGPETSGAWEDFEIRQREYLEALVAVRDMLLAHLRTGLTLDDQYVEARRRHLALREELPVQALVEARCAACASVDPFLGPQAESYFLDILHDCNRVLGQDPAPREPSDPSPPNSSAAEPWRDAEDLALLFLQVAGAKDVRLSSHGADAGLDIVSTYLVGQVKYHAKPTGRPELQRLVGANVEDKMMVCFSRRGFTTQAQDYAEQHQIALFEIELPSTVDPVNTAAYALVRVLDS